MKLLSDLKFTDLYLDADRPQDALFRGLNEQDHGLSQISIEYLDDLRGLSDRLRDAHTEEDGFLLQYGEGRYRCAVITQSINNPDQKFFCLRKISVEEFGDLWGTTSFSVKNLAKSSMSKRGMILFSGGFSSGKSRSASVAVDYWASQSNEVAVTLEDPPEYNLDRRSGDKGIIIQTNVIGGRLSQELINLRRWAPRYVFFGELRTPSMAAALLHMSISGPLCLCTIHASSSTKAIFSLVRFASEVMNEETALDIISSSLVGIVHHNRDAHKFTTVGHDFTDADSAILRAKIRNGRASSVEEELDRRERLRRM
ncbi:ATPase, T2SS/T4P/T4SS family [Pseudosulfitobacter pseudonitzschiae]|uniref:ATPase, T2SS/T4P/T4SS family n=1 Tax=Pseudosulfitobacter pseudonitzschiae TaxID=1402135 RepID=UPI003B7C08B1